MLQSGQDPHQIVSERALGQIKNTEELKDIVQRVLNVHPEEVHRIKAGEEKLMMFLVGLVMKETRGQANPEETQRLLRELIEI